MKFIHTAFLLLFVATLLHSQSLEVAPVQGNPVLRSFAAQEAAQNAAFVELLTGYNPNKLPAGDRADSCPPEPEGYFVTTGDTLVIIIDTFGLMQDTFEATLSIENQGSLLYGTIVFGAEELYLAYNSLPDLTGAATDTILFKLSQPGHDTIVPIVIHVKRKERVIITQPQTVQRESITTFCLDNELDFARPKACSRSFDCPDDYDGAGFPLHHMSSYDYPDTCLVYYASRFPGVDTVCIRICDEWGVCDVFKVPYIIPGDTISIATKPFFDDFSAYPGPYPSSDFWLDRSVYLNYTLAKDPPSVGFVTFDGLNHRGDVYNIVSGVGDRLTSKAIDLSSYTPNSNVSLRFFITPKGYGLGPEETDELTVEFRNDQREWVTVATFAGIGNVPLDSFPPFLFNGIPVDDPQFFHEAFQFRFNAKTSPGGSVDLWHVDYVILAVNADSDNRNFQDVAFTRLPTSILKNYTSLPWKHFEEDVDGEVTDKYVVGFFNHTDEPANLDGSDVNYLETTLPLDFNQHFTIDETGGNIPVRTPFDRFGTIPAGNFSQIKDILNEIDDANFRNIKTTMFIEFDGQTPDFFKLNDTIELNTAFSNYFAHDDGTAEWQLFFAHSQGVEQFASQFHANVEDELKAVQIMFPHVNGDVQEQLFNLKIWIGSLDSMPVLVRPLLKPFYPNNVFDTLQGFTTYVLDDFDGVATPVTIPADTDFFVGFQQATSTSLGIPIGFDLQNACDCNWSNLDNGDWSKFPSSLQGALMIRPVFGDVTNTNSGTDEQAEDTDVVSIFPNPTTGLVNFSLKDGNYQDFRLAIFNNLGQLVDQGNLERSLDLGHLANGLYHVQLMNEKTGELFSERLVLAKD